MPLACFTVPEPSMMPCLAGSASTAKMASGSAAITRLTDTWRVAPEVVVMATILSGCGGAVEQRPQRDLEGGVLRRGTPAR